jgi:hypothetical protein
MFMRMWQGEILRGVYPERQGEILRCAQDDSEGLRMTAGSHGVRHGAEFIAQIRRIAKQLGLRA